LIIVALLLAAFGYPIGKTINRLGISLAKRLIPRRSSRT